MVKPIATSQTSDRGRLQQSSVPLPSSMASCDAISSCKSTAGNVIEPAAEQFVAVSVPAVKVQSVKELGPDQAEIANATASVVEKKKSGDSFRRRCARRKLKAKRAEAQAAEAAIVEK